MWPRLPRPPATAFPDLPLALVGWSFGAVAVLRWQAQAGGAGVCAFIAPPVRPDLAPPLPQPEALPAARRLFLIGDRDQFTAVEDLRAYAAAAGRTCWCCRAATTSSSAERRRVAGAIASHLTAAGV